MECQQLARLFKTPFRCWPNSDWHNLQAWGGPQTNSLLVNNVASLIRMSLFTIPDWRVGMTALEEAAWREMTVASTQAGYGDGAG
eukprot:8095870-Pyramimonas_sp.AAC.1